jgi:ankyrin repeat protein
MSNIFKALEEPRYLKYLLSTTKNPNIRDQNGNTPLHIACINGNKPAVTILLDYAADIDAINDEGQSPIYNAILIDDVDLVNLLVKKGADTDIDDNDDKTPLEYAIILGRPEIEQLLLEDERRIKEMMDVMNEELYAEELDEINQQISDLLDQVPDEVEKIRLLDQFRTMIEKHAGRLFKMIHKPSQKHNK